MSAKQFVSCDWVPSVITEEDLVNAAAIGTLGPQAVLKWRAPGDECPPTPKEGEVIVFFDHMARGFSPPGSKFFRDVLAAFQLHPQDIGPNSISNICNFQVFSKVYLQEEPSVDLFRDFFHLNRRTEFTSGPHQELGGISIQKRRDAVFPHASLHTHPKDWNKSWFYCVDTSPEGENPLPGYRETRIPANHPLPQRLSAAERIQFSPQLSKLRAFMANGLIGTDFLRCWLSWSILPLSRRPKLMCKYSGKPDDPQRFTKEKLSESEVIESAKKIVNPALTDCTRVGLAPYFKKNKLPEVSIFNLYFINRPL